MKSPVFLLREYVKGLSNAKLINLYDRLSQKLPGDLAEVLNTLAENNDAHKVLSGASNNEELYDILDQIQSMFVGELEVRGLSIDLRCLVR